MGWLMFHVWVAEVIEFITSTTRAYPYWALPLAFAIAFMESFVGLSFLVPGFLLLVTLGGVLGATHASLLPAWAGAVCGAVLGDWISWWIGECRCHENAEIRTIKIWHRF